MTISLKLDLIICIELKWLLEIVKRLPRKAIDFLMALLDRWKLLLHL